MDTNSIVFTRHHCIPLTSFKYVVKCNRIKIKLTRGHNGHTTRQTVATFDVFSPTNLNYLNPQISVSTVRNLTRTCSIIDRQAQI